MDRGIKSHRCTAPYVKTSHFSKKKNLLLFFFQFARKPHAVNMLQREGGIWECRELAGDCKAGVGELGLGQGQQHLFPPPSHFGQPGIVLVIHKCKHTKYAHI